MYNKLKILQVVFFLIISYSSVAKAHLDAPPPQRIKYDLLSKNNNIEIRKYSKSIIVELDVKSNLKKSFSEGTYVIGGFLQGRNSAFKKIEPTMLPIFATKNINDTLSIDTNSEGWKVFFFIPETYQVNDVPQSENKDIRITHFKESKIVAIKIKSLDREEINKKLGALKIFLSNQNLAAKKIMITQYKEGFFSGSYEILVLVD